MSFARSPRSIAAAVRSVQEETAPQTLLAAVQAAWPRAVGPPIAAAGDPVAERDGVITIACRSATWAAELDLLQDELLARVNGLLGERRADGLRFTADAARHHPR